MARNTNKLSATGVKYETRSGRHGDGAGLYLQVSESGSRSWIFMWKDGGKRTVMGLGAYPTVSLADARDKATECRQQIARGLNPLAESRREAAPTFAVVVDRYLDDDRLAAWRNDKHKAQWKMTLGKAYCAAILDTKVDEIGTAEVVKVLKPVWQTKAETASRIRGRIERVLAFAEAKGWRQEGKNPAQWKNGLDAILPQRKKLTRGHHRAMTHAGLPAFVETLKASVGVAPRALEFLILTAARSGEAVGARWGEIDFEGKVWTIPAERMKAGREHSVPLSPRAMEILALMASTREQGNDFVFPGQRRKKAAGEKPLKPISAASMEMLLRRLEIKNVATIHGFRSSFRDWAGDETHFPREIAEAALAHTLQGVEAAYRRGTALGKRRKLMEAWANYLNSDTTKVVKIAEHMRRVMDAHTPA
ncbi:integrase arm-type DNA-binding domain-containing protein [Rhizobium jaguaris]|uniref:tyrosine-type recombinase/integrase n=1 Tax=Rhizobium jaguaris TaxID=1312183 RepID=UPI0039BF5535